MAEHARQSTQLDTPEAELDTRSSALELAGPDAIATPSPARALQSDLHSEIRGLSREPDMREVIGVLIVFCFAVWWAFYMLVAALV